MQFLLYVRLTKFFIFAIPAVFLLIFVQLTPCSESEVEIKQQPRLNGFDNSTYPRKTPSPSTPFCKRNDSTHVLGVIPRIDSWIQPLPNIGTCSVSSALRSRVSGSFFFSFECFLTQFEVSNNNCRKLR